MTDAMDLVATIVLGGACVGGFLLSVVMLISTITYRPPVVRPPLPENDKTILPSEPVKDPGSEDWELTGIFPLDAVENVRSENSATWPL